jgi:hypothetical protein
MRDRTMPNQPAAEREPEQGLSVAKELQFDAWLDEVLQRPPANTRPRLSSQPTEEERASVAQWQRAMQLLLNRCSTRYAGAVEAGRILEVSQVYELIALKGDRSGGASLLAGASLFGVRDAETLKAFKAAPKSGDQMREERHQRRIKLGGYPPKVLRGGTKP